MSRRHVFGEHFQDFIFRFVPCDEVAFVSQISAPQLFFQRMGLLFLEM